MLGNYIFKLLIVIHVVLLSIYPCYAPKDKDPDEKKATLVTKSRSSQSKKDPALISWFKELFKSPPASTDRKEVGKPTHLLSRVSEDIDEVILTFCTVLDITRVGRTNKTIHATTQRKQLWFFAFNRDKIPGFFAVHLKFRGAIDYPNYYKLTHLLQCHLKILKCLLTLDVESQLWGDLINIVPPPQNKYLLGVSLESQHKNAEAWECYTQAETEGCLFARRRINEALFYGLLGQDKRRGEERLEELRKRESAGDKNAGKYVNSALCLGFLGQDSRPGPERFEELQKRESAGDKNAGKQVTVAIYGGTTLGMEALPEMRRVAMLRQRAKEGDRDARNFENEILYNGTFDQEEIPTEQRMEELRKRGKEGDTSAAIYSMFSVYWSDLSCKHPEVINLTKLLQRLEAQGDREAMRLIDKALFEGVLGRDRKENDRFVQLCERASKGNRKAQKYVITAIKLGKVGQKPNEVQATRIKYYYKVLNFLLNTI